MARLLWITSLLAAALMEPLLAEARSAPRLEDRLQADARLLGESLQAATRCRLLAYRLGPDVDCATSEPPARYRELQDDVLALAWGRDLPVAAVRGERSLARQLACQAAIGRAVVDETNAALQRRVRHSRLPPKHHEWRETSALRGIGRHCRVEVRESRAGVVLPRVGSQCRAAVGEPGSAVAAEALARCLARLVETWVERAAPSPRPGRPNIVVILTDDQRADTLDATHSADARPIMPVVMDRLAGRGVLFERAYVTNPVCGPSRATVMTGQYTSHHRVRINGEIFDESSSVATWLSAVGYRTGFLGKYTNDYPSGRGGAGQPELIPPGWDDWKVFAGLGSIDYEHFTMVENGAQVEYGIDDGAYATDVLARQAVEFIERAAREEAPFLLIVAPTAPHFPWSPAPRHRGQLDALPPFRPPSYYEADVSDKPRWVQALPPVSVLSDLGTQLRRIFELEMLLAVDELTEDVLDSLDELGLSDDTVVIYTSDNGEGWGEHRWTSKACPWEECLRVPLVIRAPGLAPLPRTDSHTAVNVDLAPTIAELAGVPVPDSVDGDSLVRALDDTAKTWREEFLVESFSGSVRTFIGLHTPEFLFARYLNGDLELYDLVRDPHQLDNRAYDPAETDRIRDLMNRAISLWDAIRR